MKESKGKLGLWIALGAIVALLLSCLVGGLAGGVAGYWAGRQGARLTQEEGPYGFRVRLGLPLPEGEITIPPTPEVPDELPEFDEFGWEGGGALVLKVTEDSPADDAGLRPGDLIVEVDGEELGEGETLSDLVSLYEPGDEIELLVIRRGRERTIEVELGRNPDRGGETPWLGIDYQSMPGLRFRIETPDRLGRSPGTRFD